MKILVPVKRVIDHKSKIRVNQDETAISTDNVRIVMNPFCENALEEALVLREHGEAHEVIAVTIGNDKAQDVLRTALAMGADRAILIKHDEELQPLAIAKLLARIAEREKPDMIIAGKQSIDSDNNQTGQMLAAILGWSQAICVTTIEEIVNSRMTVRCAISNGTETLKIKMPCVITADLELNSPRYASLPNIIKAKSKPIETLIAGELGVNIDPKIKILKVTEPIKARKHIKVSSAEELIDILRNKEGLI